MRRVATVLFIDMVQSTERAASLGDRRWQELLARYRQAVRRSLRASGGREVDNAGDGFLAVFDSPAGAVACACALTDRLRADDVEIRSGLHMGEVETGGPKPTGIAVHIGARVAAVAEAGQVVVSSTVRDVLHGSAYDFKDLGVRALKGVPGDWRLYEATMPEGPAHAPARSRRLPILAGGAAAAVAIAIAVIVLLLLQLGRAQAPGGPRLVAVPGAGQAGLSRPIAVALDGSGRLYILAGNRVLRHEADGSLTPIAGTGAIGYTGDTGQATSASLNGPQAIAFDSAGDLFIADTGNNVVRRVDAHGVISTYAVGLSAPSGVAVGFGGAVLIADTGHNVVREVASDGIVSSVAGTGDAGYAGDGSPAPQALLNQPTCLVVDANDNLYIADAGNARVRRVGADGLIDTVAGGGPGTFSGDGGPATKAALQLATPGPLSGGGCLTADPAGDLYIADALNNRVREVTPDGRIRTVAGDGRSSTAGENGPARSAELALPLGLAIDLNGLLYVAEADGDRVVMIG